MQLELRRHALVLVGVSAVAWTGGATGVFLTSPGQIQAAGEVDRVALDVDAARFAFARDGKVGLTFVMSPADGSAVDPGSIRVERAGQPGAAGGGGTRLDTNGGVASLALARLGPGAYHVALSAEHATTGAYRLDALLTGDANGDLRVDAADVLAIQELAGVRWGDAGYSALADTDRNGVVNGGDRQRAIANLGAAVAPGGPDATVVSPPDSATSPFDRIVVEVDAPSADEVSVVNRSLATSGIPATPRFHGARHGERFFVLDVALVPGANVLVVEVTGGGATVEIAEVAVQHTLPARPLPELDATPGTVEGESGVVRLSLTQDPELPWSEALLDGEGDGSYETVLDAPGSVEVLLGAGLHVPRAILRLSNGLVVASALERGAVVSVVPVSTEAPLGAGSPSPFVDLELDQKSGGVIALDEAGAVIRLDASGGIVSAHPAAGWSGARGIGIDRDGRVYVADTGNHRIWRLDPLLGLAPDATFGNGGQVGSFGTQPSKFLSPTDVAVAELAGIERVFVADRDNGRVQRFSGTGLFEHQFDLATGVPGSELVAPVRLRAVDVATLVVMETHRVHFVTSEGLGLGSFLADELIPGLAPLADVAGSVDGFAWVAGAGGRVLALALDGDPLRELALPALSTLRAFVEERRAPFWNLLASTGDGLRRVTLREDAVGEEPADVVARFLAALLSSDGDGAAALAVPALRDTVLAIAADDAGIAALAELAPTPRLAGRSASTASVLVEASAGAPRAPFDVSVLRDLATGRWLVSQL